jgi:hypothetical protein
MTGKPGDAYIGQRNNQETKMAEDRKGISLVRLAVGAGILAAGAVALAVFVPRRRWAAAAAPLRAAMNLPIAAAVAAWATGLWDNVTAPTPPMFDDMRPFDEF